MSANLRDFPLTTRSRNHVHNNIRTDNFEFRFPIISPKKVNAYNNMDKLIEIYVSQVDEAYGQLEDTADEILSWKMSQIKKKNKHESGLHKLPQLNYHKKKNSMPENAIIDNETAAQKKEKSITFTSDTTLREKEKKTRKKPRRIVVKGKEIRPEENQKLEESNHYNLTEANERKKINSMDLSDAMSFLPVINHYTSPSVSKIDLSVSPKMNSEMLGELMRIKIQNLQIENRLEMEKQKDTYQICQLKNKISQLIIEEKRRMGNDIDEYLMPEKKKKILYMDTIDEVDDKDTSANGIQKQYLRNYDVFISKLKHEDAWKLRKIISEKLGITSNKKINCQALMNNKLSYNVRHKQVEDLLKKSNFRVQSLLMRLDKNNE